MSVYGDIRAKKQGRSVGKLFFFFGPLDIEWPSAAARGLSTVIAQLPLPSRYSSPAKREAKEILELKPRSVIQFPFSRNKQN